METSKAQKELEQVCFTVEKGKEEALELKIKSISPKQKQVVAMRSKDSKGLILNQDLSVPTFEDKGSPKDAQFYTMETKYQKSVLNSDSANLGNTIKVEVPQATSKFAAAVAVNTNR